jgi:hypothetical protein
MRLVHGLEDGMEVFLNAGEIAELDRQDPTKEKDGGFQHLIVKFQRGVDRSTGCLEIAPVDLARISHYAFDMGRGSWEKWLRHAFERTLGPKLDGNFP